MKTWDINALAVREHAPEIVSSSSDARAIVLHLPAGERLQEHEVHERAFVVVVTGEVEIEAEGGARALAGPGVLTEFEPGERHEVRARSTSRLLLLLTPWPGRGHPGALSLADKAHAREHASARQDPEAG